MPVNDTGTDQSDEKVRALTQEWMERIASAYERYSVELGEYRKVLLVSAASLFIVLMIGAVGEAVFKQSNYAPDGVIVIASKAVFIIFFLVMFGVALATLARRFQSLRKTKVDLRDLFSIANELFQMAISTEENNARNKYEYLANHIRILEIKHLLEKVKKAVEEVLTPIG